MDRYRGAFIGSLPVQGGGIMGLPEDFQQPGIGNPGRIKLNLGHLRMAGGFAAHLAIGGGFRGAAGITAGHGNDAGQPLKDRLHAPKTAAAKVGRFEGLGGSRIGTRIHRGNRGWQIRHDRHGTEAETRRQRLAASTKIMNRMIFISKPGKA